MPYIGKSPGQGVRNRFLYTATSGQTTFSGSDDDGRTLTYSDSKFTDVFLNGVLLDPNSDYNATTGTSIVLTSGATAGDIVEVISFDTFAVFNGNFTTENLNTESINGGQIGGRRNLIINGNFDVWQRGTSITPASAFGYGADRWVTYSYASSSSTISRQSFSLGQTDVPNNPVYYARVASTNTKVYFEQRIESLSRFSAETLTISFWAKSSDVSNVYLSVTSVFGSGGSANVAELSDENLGALSSSWQKFTKTFTIGSYSGKTLGTSDYLSVAITSASSDVGTIDISQVQLEVGSVATEFENRSYGEELALCQRYYINNDRWNIWSGYVVSASNYFENAEFPTTMRTAPSVSATRVGSGGFAVANPTVQQENIHGFYAYSTADSTINSGYFIFNYTADAEL